MMTEFLASSHMSTELSFHTCAAMLYSSIRGSCKSRSFFNFMTTNTKHTATAPGGKLQSLVVVTANRGDGFFFPGITFWNWSVEAILILFRNDKKEHERQQAKHSNSYHLLNLTTEEEEDRNLKLDLSDALTFHLESTVPKVSMLSAQYSCWQRLLTFVKWNCRGSSVDRETTSPRAWYSGNGLRW